MRSTVGPRVLWAVALAGLWVSLGSLSAAEAAAETKVESGADAAVEAEAEEKVAATPEATPEAQTLAQPAEAKTKGGRKSPTNAAVLAFFPGIAVHGSGHMYAGSWMKGLGLAAIEGAALGIGIATFNHGYDDIRKIADGAQNGAIPANVGTAYQSLGVIMVCGAAFLWSWFDDMAGAPIAANEYNRLAEERENQAQLKFSPMGDGAALALVKRF